MMVGEGPEKEGAERLCEELGIAHKVIFLGNSNEIDKTPDSQSSNGENL